MSGCHIFFSHRADGREKRQKVTRMKSNFDDTLELQNKTTLCQFIFFVKKWALSFRVVLNTAKLSTEDKELPCTCYLQPVHIASLLNMLHQTAVFATINEPPVKHHCHPKLHGLHWGYSIKVHSWYCTFYIVMRSTNMLSSRGSGAVPGRVLITCII